MAFEQVTKQELLFIALIGAGVGLLLGLIPLILAIRKGKLRLGVYAVICSIVGGAFNLLIPLVVIAIFIWLILRKPAATKSDDVTDPSDSMPS